MPTVAYMADELSLVLNSVRSVNFWTIPLPRRASLRRWPRTFCQSTYEEKEDCHAAARDQSQCLTTKLVH